MTNRREFLHGSASVSALSFGSGLALPEAFARAEADSIRVHKGVIDDRYAESRIFAEAIGRMGVQAESLQDGDATDLWRRQRAQMRRRQHLAFAGLTQFGPMFVFEQLAREHGMKLVLRIEHQPRSDGTIAHTIAGPRNSLALAETQNLQGADWPIVMAALTTHCRAGGADLIESTIIAPGARPAMKSDSSRPGAPSPESVIHYYLPHAIREGREIPWDGTLFSWLIAPGAVPPNGPAASRRSHAS